jgi:chromatin remodeling complex protein RSC6
MKKLLFIVLSLALSAPMIAQQGQGQKNRGQQGMKMQPEKRAVRQTDHMKSYLDLADAKWEEVHAINLAFSESQKVAKETHRGDRTAMQAAMTEAKETRNQALKKALKRKDYKRFLEEQEKMQQRNKQKGKRGKGKGKGKGQGQGQGQGRLNNG